MDRFERILTLHNLLRSRRYPVAATDLADQLGCKQKTLKQTIEDMRIHMGAPIEYNRSGSPPSAPAGLRMNGCIHNRNRSSWPTAATNFACHTSTPGN